jgi:hypothetical protein
MTENFETDYESSIPNQDFWENDGISMTGNPYASPDTIVFGDTHLSGGMGNDHINFTGNPFVPFSSSDNVVLNPPISKNHLWKYNEDQILKDVSEYVTSTYGSHYPPISKNHLWKYNEDQILKDVSEYVTSTYGSHYCGQNQEYKDIQTIDLIAAKDLAPNFCQSNILKYGSRYGAKNGRNKSDLLKVIHYAMLLLHFDGHYTRKNNGLSEFK